jgi:hypothetical protein
MADLTDPRVARYDGTRGFVGEFRFVPRYEFVVYVNILVSKKYFRRGVEKRKELYIVGQRESTQDVLSVLVETDFGQVVGVATVRITLAVNLDKFLNLVVLSPKCVVELFENVQPWCSHDGCKGKRRSVHLPLRALWLSIFQPEMSLCALRAFPALACSVCSMYKCYISELEGFLRRTRSDNDKTSVTYIHTLLKH